jgi:peptide deformylase
MNLKEIDNNALIKINTDDALKLETPKAEVVETFDLVAEDDPVLFEVLPEFDFDNAPVNPNSFASTLVETCIANKGYGLSANQCGFRHRVFVMGAGEEYVAFFNPKVIRTEGEKHMAEGCLSFPMMELRITRPEQIWVEYQDYNGNKKEAHYVGLSARCFLHELDHMDGIVYTKRAKPLALQSGLKKRNKVKQLIAKAEKANAKKFKYTAKK